MKRLKKILMDQNTDMARSPRFIGSHRYTSEVHRRWQAALWVGCTYDEIDPVSEWHGGVLDMVGELQNLAAKEGNQAASSHGVAAALGCIAP
jgi:hypothetical protein